MATKQDNLWVKWVHAVYIKSDDRWECSPGSGASWYWKKICEMKTQLKRPYSKEDFYALNQYKVGENYDVLVGDPLQMY